ncbi:RlmF-related methyltransferase, partial [Salmonella enterica subsp. enterica serovar Infantis]
MSAHKPGLHTRNRHQQRYHLDALSQTTPQLTTFLIRT